MPEMQPRPSSHFRLTLGGMESAGMFREVSGLKSETEVIEQKSVDANGNPIVRKVPGATKWSDIVLKRGLDENLELWEKREKVIKEGPENARVDGTIEMIDYTGAVIATYSILQAWIREYEGASLNAAGNEVAVESITLCHEGLKRE